MRGQKFILTLKIGMRPSNRCQIFYKFALKLAEGDNGVYDRLCVAFV
jgi:hypothetical protein